MRVIFRADASADIGVGHVMRCATLARALQDHGYEVGFLCRPLPGNLIAWLIDQGLSCYILNSLITTEAEDAAATLSLLEGQRWDWMVVDHYQLGAFWETKLDKASRGVLFRYLMVIDDLGRAHHCHLLLDQNYPNPDHARYAAGLGRSCRMLLGQAYALLRPEFSALRPHALAKSRTEIQTLVVFMGGGDTRGEVSKALAGIAQSRLAHCAVDIILGQGNSEQVRLEALCLGHSHLHLHIQTCQMAHLLAAADLAIAAGGTNTWERCTLGLPSLVTLMAPNQVQIAHALEVSSAQQILGNHYETTPSTYAQALNTLTPAHLAAMSLAARQICDGDGIARVLAAMTVTYFELQS